MNIDLDKLSSEYLINISISKGTTRTLSITFDTPAFNPEPSISVAKSFGLNDIEAQIVGHQNLKDIERVLMLNAITACKMEDS